MNNAIEVLKAVNEKIENINKEYKRRYKIQDICTDLSIFDWWNDYVSLNKLKQMKSFLELAISMGFDGYVCFKVGASGCSNGMWAHKEESKDGFSPDGDFLYRSFTPDYTCYSLYINNEMFPEKECWNSLKTQKQLKDYIVANNL